MDSFYSSIALALFAFIGVLFISLIGTSSSGEAVTAWPIMFILVVMAIFYALGYMAGKSQDKK